MRHRPPENRNAAGASRGVGDRHSGSIKQSLDKPISSALRESIFTAGHQGELRKARRVRQTRHLHAAGPRPTLEALLAVEAGESLDEVLADFARIPVSVYHVLGAEEFPLLAVVNGGRA
jgi:hypothetical protein